MFNPFKALIRSIENAITWLSDANNLIILAVIVGFGTLGGFGFYFALLHYDFLASRFLFQISCTGLTNTPAAVALISSFFFGFIVLVTLGDLMQNIDNRRRGDPANWSNTLLFGGIALAAGAAFVVIIKISC
ncbi:MAG: hypothetical protein ACYC2R_00705 [Burkholderiales bacterium]